MGTRRRFSTRFKRQIVEEYLAGVSTQAQLARRYDISPHLIIQWRKRYSEGRLDRDNDPESLAKEAGIRELESAVADRQADLRERAFKKAVQHTLQERNEDSLIISGPGPAPSNGGAK